MRRLSILCLLFLLFTACGLEPEVEKPEEKGPLSITISDEVYNYYPADIVTSTLSLNTPNIYSLVVQYAKRKTNANAYGIVFGFADNKFVEASLRYEKEDGKKYRTADFNPLETFSIKNYKFDEIAKTVSFEYEGKMYETSETVNTSAKSITVKGKIDTKISFVDKGPFTPLAYANFTSENYSFTTIRAFTLQNNNVMTVYMNYFTNTGERLQLAVNQSFFASIFPVTYTFDLDDTVNNLTYMKFIGSPRGTGQDVLRPEDWKTFPTKGKLTLNKISPDYYSGTFSIEVYDDDKLLHKTDNGTIFYSPKNNYPMYH